LLLCTSLLQLSKGFDTLLQKLDAEGKPVWEHMIATETNTVLVWGMVSDGQGGAVLIGNDSVTNDDPPTVPYIGFVERVDAQGNLAWRRELRTPGMDTYVHEVFADERGYRIAGYIQGDSDVDFSVTLGQGGEVLEIDCADPRLEVL